MECVPAAATSSRSSAIFDGGSVVDAAARLSGGSTILSGSSRCGGGLSRGPKSWPRPTDSPTIGRDARFAIGYSRRPDPINSIAMNGALLGPPIEPASTEIVGRMPTHALVNNCGNDAWRRPESGSGSATPYRVSATSAERHSQPPAATGSVDDSVRRCVRCDTTASNGLDCVCSSASRPKVNRGCSVIARSVASDSTSSVRARSIVRRIADMPDGTVNQRQCVVCSRPFASNKSNKVYCSPICRRRNSHRVSPLTPSPEAALQVASAATDELARVRDHLRTGNIYGALKIASDWPRLGDIRHLVRNAWQAYRHPEWFEDSQQIIATGLVALRRLVHPTKPTTRD